MFYSANTQRIRKNTLIRYKDTNGDPSKNRFQGSLIYIDIAHTKKGLTKCRSIIGAVNKY